MPCAGLVRLHVSRRDAPVTAPIQQSPQIIAVCESRWHRPVAFTPGCPGAGVCLCGRFIWQPVDRDADVEVVPDE